MAPSQADPKGSVSELQRDGGSERDVAYLTGISQLQKDDRKMSLQCFGEVKEHVESVVGFKGENSKFVRVFIPGARGMLALRTYRAQHKIELQDYTLNVNKGYNKDKLGETIVKIQSTLSAIGDLTIGYCMNSLNMENTKTL